MNDDEVLTLLTETAKETWEHTVSQDGRHARWLPKLVTVDQDGAMSIFMLAAEGDPVPMIAEAAAQVTTPSTAWIAVTIDAYGTNDQRIAERVNRGEVRLSVLYQAEVEGVVDVLFVYGLNRAGKHYSRSLPYRVRGRKVQWLPPLVGNDLEGATVEGRIPDALTRAFE